MGIGFGLVHLLSRVLPSIGTLSNKKLLTVGVQDCQFSYPELQSFLARHEIPTHAIPPERIRLTTGFKWVSPADRATYTNNVHQETLFAALGIAPDSIFALDINDFEGATILQDLNLPVPPSLENEFDIIIESGTIEHVFSISQAFFNLSRMCRLGGLVISLSPADMINHGFYNLNAEVFRDFFAANGFEEIMLKYISLPHHPTRRNKFYLEFDPENWSTSLPAYNSLIFSAYKKVKELPSRVIPQQGFYNRLWESEKMLATKAKGPRMLTKARSGIRNAIDCTSLTSLLVRSSLQHRRGKVIHL